MSDKLDRLRHGIIFVFDGPQFDQIMRVMRIKLTVCTSKGSGLGFDVQICFLLHAGP